MREVRSAMRTSIFRSTTTVAFSGAKGVERRRDAAESDVINIFVVNDVFSQRKIQPVWLRTPCVVTADNGL